MDFIGLSLVKLLGKLLSIEELVEFSSKQLGKLRIDKSWNAEFFFQIFSVKG